EDLDVAPHRPAPSGDPCIRLRAALTRSRAQLPVSDAAQEVGELAARWRELAAWRTTASLRQAQQLREQQEANQRTYAAVTRTLQRTQSELTQASRGLAILRKRGERSRLAARREQLELRLAVLGDELATIEQRLHHLPSPDEVAAKSREWVDTDRTLRQIAEQRSTHHLTHPPAYLLTTIGTPPPDSEGRRAWQEAASRIEAYRLRWEITDPQRPLGSAPLLAGLQQRDHDHAALALDQARHSLHRTHGHEHSTVRGLIR
ncbi:MAG: hypothetical protein M3N32_00835, partial [Actinomycetota bacterium]|nr:hypothetical protein [Actinomycetota bacterium]